MKTIGIDFEIGILEDIKEKWGGTLKVGKPSTENHNVSYTLVVCDNAQSVSNMHDTLNRALSVHRMQFLVQ